MARVFTGPMGESITGALPNEHVIRLPSKYSVFYSWTNKVLVIKDPFGWVTAQM